MAAEIIQFPKKKFESKKYKSVDLYYCWDHSLNNPLLNNLFKQETSYVERWYLQTTHLLNIEDFGHPMLLLLFSENDNTLDKLESATEKDLAIHKYFSEKSSLYVVNPNILKLTRWLTKWKSLQQYRHRLYKS